MTAIDIFETCINSLKRHKWRTVLAMLGIAIGIGGISAMTIFTDSIGSAIKQEIELFGINNFSLYPTTQYQTYNKQSNITKLNLSDIAQIEGLNLPITAITPIITKTGLSSFNTKERISSIFYTNQYFETVSLETLAQGRFINALDIKFEQAVCLIDQDIKNALFESINPIGQKLTINNEHFTIVGVIKPKERTLINWIEQRASKPSRVIIPISYYLSKIGHNKIDKLIITVKDVKDINWVANAIIDKLETVYPNTRFKYGSKQREINSFNSIIYHLRWLFYIITAISLLVGGIGVANVMIISVLERTREIGIRKTCGASPKQIFIQFLSESLFICVLSGIIGLIVGLLISIIGLKAYNGLIVIPTLKVAIIFIVTLCVGITSGLAPAIKASNLSIVDAIRYD